MPVTNWNFWFVILLLNQQIVLFSQDLTKAHHYYQEGAYAKAIPLYEAALARKTQTAVQSKLANAYRILNQPQKAASIYAQLVEKESITNKDFFHYAETLMSLGDYEQAKKYLTRYQNLVPEDSLTVLLLDACDKVKTIPAYFSNVELFDFQHNTSADENAPFFYKENLLYASDVWRGFELLKQSNGVTGRDFVNIYMSEQWDESTFGSPELFARVNELNKNTGNVSFSSNGREMYFCRNGWYPSRGGAYNMQLFRAVSKDGEHWQQGRVLSFCKPDNNYLYPAISPDGKMLFFVADKAQGFGGMDLYVSHRTRKGWSKPENLGATVNTTGHEAFPFYAGEGKLYFASKGHAGFGGFDMFVTRYDSSLQQWQKPINLGMPLNSSYDDHSFCLDSTGRNGAFASSRNGRGDDIFLFRTPTPAQFVREDSHSFLKDTLQPAYLQNIIYSINNNLLKINQRFEIEGMDYDSLSHIEIRTEQLSALEKLSHFLKQHPRLKVEIGVHLAHNAGTMEWCKRHSNQRAEHILQQLLQYGVSASQLRAKGYGKARPLKDCSEGDCSPEEVVKNERIELKIKGL